MIGSKWQQQARLIVVSSLFVGWIRSGCERPNRVAAFTRRGRKEKIGLSDNHPTSHTQSDVRDAPLFELSLSLSLWFLGIQQHLLSSALLSHFRLQVISSSHIP